jgi:hypothetical protein
MRPVLMYSQACFTSETCMPNNALLPRKVALNMFWCQWAYWCALAMAAYGYRYFPDGGTRSALILTPVLLAVLIVAYAYWIYDACDEFIRLRILKCVVITATAVALLTLGYFFLELFGFPRLSMVAVNLFGWSVFNLSLLYVIIRSR